MTKLLRAINLNDAEITLKTIFLFFGLFAIVALQGQVSTYSFSQSTGTYATYVGTGTPAAGGA
ncbi:MAG: hypothetical protein RL007_938, partial [Bacteroidota bacterium]